MNEVTQESKDKTIKTLAIIGFIGVIILGVWLAVQVVRVTPGAFSSLASITDSLYNTKVDTLTVETDKDIVNVGDSFAISWNDVKRSGTFGFHYQCSEVVSLDVRTNNTSVRTITCGEEATFPDTVNSIDLLFFSEKKRFTDVLYTVSFQEIGKTESL